LVDLFDGMILSVLLARG